MSCRYLHHDMPAPGRWHRLWCAECRKARAADATLALGVECMKAQAFPEAGLSRTLTALGLPSSPAQRRRRLRLLRRRFLLPTGALTLLFALAGYSWLRYIDLDPNIPVPMPVMPDPNAYDAFVAAGKELKEEEHIAYALNPSSWKSPPERMEIRNWLAKMPLPLKEQEKLLKQNEKALQLVRLGLSHPYQEPPARSVKAMFPHFAKFRSLARLLAFEAQVKAERGDWKGAANSGLDAIQLGTQIPSGSILIGKLVGIACEAIGQPVVLEAIDHLNAAEAQEIADRLAKIMARRVTFVETLQEEKWLGLASLQNDVFVPGWRWNAYSSLWNPEHIHQNEVAVQNFAWYLWLLRYSKRQIVENYAGYMDRVIAKARAGMIKPDSIRTPGDPICQILLPEFAQSSLKDAVNATQNTMLHTTLALRAYRLETGAYPRSLDPLVPRYMKVVPTDRFRPDRTLSYRTNGSGYILYSFGPDQKDDGGVSITKPEGQRSSSVNGVGSGPGHKRIRTDSSFVLWESLGDIIIGEDG
jgi:hypothetical protein